MNILVADIGGTNIKVGMFTKYGKIELFKEFETESEKGGPHVVANLIEIFEGYEGFDAIGISTAGQVNSVEGSIIYANENIPQYTGTKLKTILEAKFNVPVKVENDVNAAALGEQHFGAAQNFADFLCLTFGTGIGGAIVIDSKLYKGHNGVAAEFGHIILHHNGEPCNCGNKGCFESYASTTALIKKAKKLNPAYVNGRIIFKEINTGNKELTAVLESWVLEVALGIASLIHCFNPAAVVIGGGVMEQPLLIQLVKAQVMELTMKSFSEVQLVKASLGNKAGLLGAASLHIK